MHGLLATLLFCGLTQAATVFLSPQEFLPSVLSPQQANLVLAAHLGLEQFEVVDQPGRLNHLFAERDFVGKGDESALLLVLDQLYARDVVPSTLKPSFSSSLSTLESLSSFIKKCNRRASHVYTYVAGEPSVPTEGIPRALDIFSAPTSANEAFLAEMSTLVNYLDARSSRFAAFELKGISELVASYGRSSEQYDAATKALRAVIETALADTSIHLALVTVAPSTHKRSPPPEQQAVKVFSSCYGSFSECADATDYCSGHGACINVSRAEPSCYVCSCGATISEAGKVEKWAGERCQQKDVSGPFALITGITITLILLIGGSISFLYTISNHELPSILTGGVTGGVRRE